MDTTIKAVVELDIFDARWVVDSTKCGTFRQFVAEAIAEALLQVSRSDALDMSSARFLVDGVAFEAEDTVDNSVLRVVPAA